VSWSTTLKNQEQIRAHLKAGEEIAVMFSDIRGFTSYTARRGDKAAYELSRIHDVLLRQHIEGKDGIVVKTMGDGIMAAFAELSSAVYAAVEIHRAVRKRNAEYPSQSIDIGIGLASGMPIMKDIDLIGNSVNLSQRLCTMAKGGQILVTERFAHETTPPDGCHFMSLGRRGLKGLADVNIYEVQWMGELARLSDRDDMFTLILTERGTLAIELAKNIQAHIDNAVVQLGAIGGNEDFSSRLQRGIAKFTQAVINKSLAATGIDRERPIDEVNLSIDDDEVTVHIGKKPIRLHGVDPARAKLFRDKMIEMRQRLRAKSAE
jgi:class 3 adenylate cyclase